jgi:GNAT superfamily N-acetyltransferase
MIEISTNKRKLQIDVIHQFLNTTYWAKGRTLEEVKETIKYSFCVGVYLDNKQIGFARVATDYTVFAYVMDVFILTKYRGNGYSKLLMRAINNEPSLKTCKVWMLKTSDAHELYKQYGYTELKNPDKVMERLLK